MEYCAGTLLEFLKRTAARAFAAGQLLRLLPCLAAAHAKGDHPP
jgi:hypothetical protein